jgi:hypothetical protein
VLYKRILKLIWTYGIQLWGCTKQINIKIIQCFQNKVFRNIVDAPWYMRNSDLHRDLEIDTVGREIKKGIHGNMRIGFTNTPVSRLYNSCTRRI